MKKFLKILFKSIFFLMLFIILTLIIIPLFFKEDIMIKVKEEINKNVKAKVEFTDFSLSLFRNFPDFSLSLDELSVRGVDQFADDTLMQFKSFQVQVDLISAIKKNVEVKGITLVEPVINAIVLKDSTANWDVAVESEPIDEVSHTSEEKEEEFSVDEPKMQKEGEEASSFKVALKKFEIRDAEINYSDDVGNMSTNLADFNFLLKGNFSADYSDLELNTSIEAINVDMGGIKYLKDASFFFNAIVGADLANNKFSLKDNRFGLNALELGFSGDVEMKDEDIDVDIKFATNEPGFKALLSMVPAIFLEDLTGLQTGGTLAFSGDISGTYNDQQTPSANLKLQVNNAMIQYPDLPESISNINIDLDVNYDGIDTDKTKVDLNKFHLELAGNPFDIAMHVRTPMSDPAVNGSIKGDIVLNTLSNAIPLDDMTIDGEVGINVDIAGNYSSIEKEKYDEFKADGEVTLKDFIFESEDVPDKVNIKNAQLLFSPQYLELAKLSILIGESDISLTGKVLDYLGYVMTDETVKGNFVLASNFLDVNKFMTEEEITDEGEAGSTTVSSENERTDEVTESIDTVATEMATLEIPGDIDFKLKIDLKHLLYDSIDINNLNGVLKVKDKQVHMDNLNMQVLDGSISVDGKYDSRDISKPAVDMGLNIEEMEIQSAVNSFSMLEKMAPVLKNCKGKISLKFDYTSLLDNEMSPVLSTIDGYGKLKSKSIEVVDSETFDKLIDALKLTGKDLDNTFEDVNVSFSITDGRIIVEPFETNIEEVKFVIGGSHGIDQTMDYDLAVSVPRKMLGSAANDLVDGLLSKVADQGLDVKLGEYINFNVRVYGETMDPKIDLGLKKSSGDSEGSTKKEMVQEVKKEVVKEGKKELAKEADKLVKDAEAEAAKIKAEAREQADKLLKDGEKEADKLVEKAAKEGPLAKIAAKKAADVLKKEAQEKADKLIAEADKKADKIVADAQKKSDEMLKEE